jgi:DNA-binding LytR/AlgR family response regulator
MSESRIWLHVDDVGTRRIVDPEEVYWIEAVRGDTFVRFRGRRRIKDLRPFAEVAAAFAAHGFARVHRNHAVNLRRVLEVRRRSARDWELKLEPPVNRVLRIGRGYLPVLEEFYS